MWNTVACEMDAGPASQVAMGLITLASDTVSEPEITAFLPDQAVGLYASRLPMSPTATVDSLVAMQSHLRTAAELLVPDDHLDVIGYGCTAGATLIGSDNIKRIIQEVRQDHITYSDPILAGIAALRASRCQKIALLTPYIDSVGDIVVKHFQAQGIEIVAKASFKKSGDPEIARISPASVYEAAIALGSTPDIDGLFISCTALRVSGVIESIEKNIQKPVISSNQAMVWHCLQLAGYTTKLLNRGRLFRQ